MTLKELSQLYHLNREIEMDKKRLEELKAKVTNPSSPNITDMPSGGSCENRIERYVEEIVDIEAIISAKITQCLHERNRLERYIADIPNSKLRQIFALRFINGFSWVQIAFSIGNNCTADSARMACKRYIAKSNKQK